MKYIVVIIISLFMASCADNSSEKTNIEDSSTINEVKQETGNNSSANTDSIPGVNNGGSTVSGTTGAASPGSGVSMPANADSTKNKRDTSRPK